MSLNQQPTPVPTIVVVDSRNVIGSAKRLFGSTAAPTPEGVKQALIGYGFEALDVYVAIATTTNSTRPSSRLTQALEVNERYAALVNASPLGTVLEARLVERSGQMEEKLADVLCAMQIARAAHAIRSGASSARAIVVLSEDMDLIPAYRFAQDLEVPIFAAACDTVDTRSDSSWLLLCEGAMRTACQRPHGRLVGGELRAELAKWLTARDPIRVNFKVTAWEERERRLLMRHNSGAIGYWYDPPSSVSRQRGTTQTVAVTGIEAQAERDFPYLQLQGSDATWPPPNVRRGVVRGWRTPTRVEVEIDGSTRTLQAPTASLVPGATILVQVEGVGSQLAWRVIGRTSLAPTQFPHWGPHTPQIARITTGSTSPGARVRGALSSGEEVTIQPPGSDSPRPGQRYAVLPVSAVPVPSGSVHHVTVAVSSVLP